MNKITELKLTFEKPHTEEFLKSKGFVKEGDTNRLFKLKKNELSLFYTFATIKDEVKYTELVIYIDENKVTMYYEAKEFKLEQALKILKYIDINICSYVEIHGLGDIRKQLMRDKNWIVPSWIKNSLLYVDEHSGLSYHQDEKFYRICYDKENIDIKNLFKCEGWRGLL